MQLEDATWPEIAALNSTNLLAIPVGSLEQHGPHLPFNTDTQIATALTAQLVGARPDVVAAPALPFGASGEHAGFPGTLLLDHDLLASVLVELVRSAREAFCGVVLVSAHGGNAEALAQVRARCSADGDDVLVWSPPPLGGDAHAGRTETSIMLAIDPGAVRMELAQAGNVDPLASLMPRLRSEGVRPISSNGVLGDPTEAGATEGRDLVNRMAANLVGAVGDRWPDPRAAW